MPRIRHVAIVSPNRERLVHFYTKAFDMRVIYGRPRSTHLSDGNFNLAIVDQQPDLKAGFTRWVSTSMTCKTWKEP